MNENPNGSCFSWFLFWQCTKNCGVGVKVREIQCYDTRDQRLLRPFHCQATSPRPPVRIPCNIRNCLEWYTSSWGQVKRFSIQKLHFYLLSSLLSVSWSSRYCLLLCVSDSNTIYAHSVRSCVEVGSSRGWSLALKLGNVMMTYSPTTFRLVMSIHATSGLLDPGVKWVT